jgi:hypothetical protein
MIAEQLASETLIPCKVSVTQGVDKHSGSIPLLHPSAHKFRDCDPTRFIGSRTLMNFTYMPAAQRALLQQSQTQALLMSCREPGQKAGTAEFRTGDKTRVIQPRFQYMS